ncbi:hypothetical protein GCM10010985_29040 [Caballeronia grimmiae]|uniref:Uncharacterized protein n=1 Tax=Caballeronia grimmiae TaxID=1071679 RepID=A0ABQ1RKF2_9BURK|nr:hypothetical protein GCM10010985_29040 [Caballeronia grimmiae]
MRNGINVLTGSSVTLALILYLNGIVFARNSRGVWYQNGVPWKNIGTIDPRNVVKPSNTSLFYGINGHMAWGSGIYNTMTAEQQLAILKDLGVTMYRCDTADAGMSTTLAMALRGAFAGSGVGIMPVLNPRSSDWNPRGTEATAYSLGYDLAVRCTQPLKGLVTHIECGNELDTVGLQIGGDGSHTSDWNPAEWPSFRGVIRGMIAGVKAVDPTIKCGVNVRYTDGLSRAANALERHHAERDGNGRIGCGDTPVGQHGLSLVSQLGQDRVRRARQRVHQCAASSEGLVQRADLAHGMGLVRLGGCTGGAIGLCAGNDGVVLRN